MSDLLSTLRRWVNNISPGGYWDYGGFAGLWHLNLDHGRSYTVDLICFRPEELADLVRDAEEAPKLRARVAELLPGGEYEWIASVATVAIQGEEVSDA